MFMSLAEIEKAIDQLPPKELTKLAAHIARRDKLAWDKELEEDFVPSGEHEKALEKIGISRRFRDVACAEVILEVLGPAACAHSEARGKGLRAV
jgi:hypothetical protein